MPLPEGKLTAAQFELMQLIWNSETGMTVAELRDVVCQQRPVSRTTILNLVGRLEKRGWLTRRKTDSVYRYRATVSQQETERDLAADFVSEFFDGSAEHLVLSLIGSKRVSRTEIERLRQLLNNLSSTAPHRGTQSERKP